MRLNTTLFSSLGTFQEKKREMADLTTRLTTLIM